MNKRQTLVEMFSTFLKVDVQRDSLDQAWKTDLRLKQSMLLMLEASPDGSQ